MNVDVSPKAAKYLDRLNQPLKGRILQALIRLEEDPPQGDIKALSGRSGFRLRVGDYRILFNIAEDSIVILEIGPRGDVYKGGQ